MTDPATVVDAEALVAAPAMWHGHRIDVTSRWTYAFEYSGFAGVWLDAPASVPVTYGTYLARVVGTWSYRAAQGYGHMGAWPGELRAESIEIVETLARTPPTPDGLTGLPKRDAIGDAFASARRPLSLAVLDLDWFKRINDRHGFAVGDDVLRACARATVEALRPEDVVVRWGGEELAVLLPGATLEAAHEMIRRVLVRVRALVIATAETPVSVSLSAAVVEIGADEPFSSAFERADRGLYAAKRDGRDRVVLGPRLA